MHSLLPPQDAPNREGGEGETKGTKDTFWAEWFDKRLSRPLHPKVGRDVSCGPGCSKRGHKHDIHGEMRGGGGVATEEVN